MMMMLMMLMLHVVIISLMNHDDHHDSEYALDIDTFTACFLFFLRSLFPSCCISNLKEEYL